MRQSALIPPSKGVSELSCLRQSRSGRASLAGFSPTHVPTPLFQLELGPLWAGVRGLLVSGLATGPEMAAYLDAHPQDLQRLSASTVVVAANPAAVALYGAPSEVALFQVLPTLLEPHWTRLHRDLAVALADGTATTVCFEGEHRTYLGQTLWVRLTVEVPDVARHRESALVSVVDLTEEAERERIHRDAARTLGEHTGERWLREAVAFIARELGAGLSFVAARDEEGRSLTTVAAFPEDASVAPTAPLTGADCLWERTLAGGKTLYVEDVSALPELDGFLAETGARALVVAPVVSASGQGRGVVGALYRERPDNLARTESALELLAARALVELERAAADAKHAMLEAQLVHAQRLESVGRLAGGIAHDFNNLLAPILAYAEMAREDLSKDTEAYDDLQEIIGAAERASRIARKLLAFSRQQLLDIHTVDVNAILLGFTRMIRTVIRENIHLETSLPNEPAPVSADEGQVEQILMNLILNAQDAMPDGGSLEIRTRHHRQETGSGDLAEGSYVCLEVTDSGTGMDEDTLLRIFEPFFTTKEVNEGTGLGLAMVYGIMQQHRGAVKVESRVGEGTTFRLYFPAAPAATTAEDADAMVRSPRSGSERILVVEDEAVVRRVLVNMLHRQGYEVMAADKPSVALEIALDPSNVIDLMVSDVVMPEMSGVDLYDRIRRARPSLPVLYVSGYAHDVTTAHGVELIDLLQKPFSPKDLTARIESLLDA